MNWAEFFNNIDDLHENFIKPENLKPEQEEAPPDLVIRVPANILSGNCSLATFSAYVASLTEEECKKIHLLDYIKLMRLIGQMPTPAQIDAHKTEPLTEDK